MSLCGLVQGCTQEGQAPPVTEAWNFIDYKPVVAVRGSADLLVARESCAKIIGCGPFGCLEARRLSLDKSILAMNWELCGVLSDAARRFPRQQLHHPEPDFACHSKVHG